MERIKTAERIAYLDILKGLAVFLVVWGHTLQNGGRETIAAKIIWSRQSRVNQVCAGLICQSGREEERSGTRAGARRGDKNAGKM